MLLDVNPRQSGPVLENIATDVFLNSIDSNLKKRIQNKMPRTSADALRMVLQIEAFEEADGRGEDD